ncbi:MAG: YerC/YecD family TrpR-related protein [Candidatus Peregrinibacteria bacterium]
MDNSWKTTAVENLAETIKSLNTTDELCSFLRDLLTKEELFQASLRWQAVLLLKDEIPYREIAQKTGLSTTTVARISFWLQNGEGGYKAALSRFQK